MLLFLLAASLLDISSGSSCIDLASRLDLRDQNQTGFDERKWCVDVSTNCSAYYVTESQNNGVRLCIDEGEDGCSAGSAFSCDPAAPPPLAPVNSGPPPSPQPSPPPPSSHPPAPLPSPPLPSPPPPSLPPPMLLPIPPTSPPGMTLAPTTPLPKSSPLPSLPPSPPLPPHSQVQSNEIICDSADATPTPTAVLCGLEDWEFYVVATAALLALCVFGFLCGYRCAVGRHQRKKRRRRLADRTASVQPVGPSTNNEPPPPPPPRLPKRAQQTVNNAVDETLSLMEDALETAGAAASDAREETWTLEKWLSSIHLDTVVSQVLLVHIRHRCFVRFGRTSAALEKAFMVQLGAEPAAQGRRRAKRPGRGRETLEAMLTEGEFVDRLVDGLWVPLQQLSLEAGAAQEAKAKRLSCTPSSTPALLVGKFVEDSAPPPENYLASPTRATPGSPPGKLAHTLSTQKLGQARELVFGDVSDFMGGLGGLVGPQPSDEPVQAMANEHCSRADATAQFYATNYGTTTSSATEWHFVTDPTDGLKAVGLDEWPMEEKLVSGRPEQRRQPLPLHALADARARVDERLRALGSPSMLDSEVIAGRMYTGPCFIKYSTVLRGISGRVEFFRQKMDALCCGNRYEATIHMVQACLTKLSRLQRAERVYRGLLGSSLPNAFRFINEYNVRGGVEYGFMSTTSDRSVAMSYARGDAGTVLEIQQGMVDRGADLTWLSQYPHEHEICFSPLTALEVLESYVEGSVLVVVLRASSCRVEGGTPTAPKPAALAPQPLRFESKDDERAFAKLYDLPVTSTPQRVPAAQPAQAACLQMARPLPPLAPKQAGVRVPPAACVPPRPAPPEKSRALNFVPPPLPTVPMPMKGAQAPRR